MFKDTIFLYNNFGLVYCAEEKDKSNGTKAATPKRMKSKAKLISPQLLACKIETNTVEMPPALRQRHIQLQALQASRTSADLLAPQPLTIQTVQNDLRHRKKAVIVDDINQSISSGTTTSDDDSGADENGHFESYLVIEFSPDIQKKTLHWIIDKIRTRVSRGGAGLLIKREPQTKYRNFIDIIIWLFILIKFIYYHFVAHTVVSSFMFQPKIVNFYRLPMNWIS